MLVNAKESLSNNKIDYIFLSSHSEDLHQKCINFIDSFKYTIEVSSGFDSHTTSCDGFILARRNNIQDIIKEKTFLGRLEIARSNPKYISQYLNKLK
tara:strand:- start:314 stop:604 length:291 start_codon:yes stop_codon:yes gene_type:complete